MNIDKRDQNLKNMYVAIHTLSGWAVTANEEKKPIHITAMFFKNGKCYLKINPNKGLSNNQMISSYSDFLQKINDILKQIEAKSFIVTRADIAINSDNKGDYDRFSKLNRAILASMAVAYNVKNTYCSKNLLTYKALNMAIKNDQFEAECYDKTEESNGTTNIANRLELRSKRLNKPLESLDSELLTQWRKRLNKTADCFVMMQECYNVELLRIWQNDCVQPKAKRQYITLTSFLMQYQESIFTLQQLRELVKLIGVNNADNYATKYRDTHSIELISQTDINVTVKGIIKKIENYLHE